MSSLTRHSRRRDPLDHPIWAGVVGAVAGVTFAALFIAALVQ